jgi:hypothetical protein
MIARSRSLLALVAMGLLAASCSGSGPQLQIGIKRTALDLAFKDESLPAPAPEIRRIFQEIAVPPVALPAQLEPALSKLPPRPLVLCPKAPPDAVPEQPVSTKITKPPLPGKYTYLTSGTVKITLPPPLPSITLPVILPLRPEVKNVRPVQLTDTTGAPTQVAIQYEVKLAVGSLSTNETFQIRSDGLYLLRREFLAGGPPVVFEPNPPVLMYEFGGENNTWNGPGFDGNTKTAMLVQGRILRRDNIDVCGTVVDSYRSSTSEDVVTTDGSYQSQTERFADCPEQSGEACGTKTNLRNFASHLGPIPVRQEFHYTDRVVVATPNGAATATIEWNYTMTLASLNPSPI